MLAPSNRAVGHLAALVFATFLFATASDLVTVGSSGREHPVVGRFSVSADVGGAVWSFRPGGQVIVSGPGDLVSRGDWTPGLTREDFDASIEVPVTGQQLRILGTVSSDALTLAMLVRATAPDDAGGGVPWPVESRLIGTRLGMIPEPTPGPSPTLDCERPRFTELDLVDWDRCDQQEPHPSAGAAAGAAASASWRPALERGSMASADPAANLTPANAP